MYFPYIFHIIVPHKIDHSKPPHPGHRSAVASLELDPLAKSSSAAQVSSALPATTNFVASSCLIYTLGIEFEIKLANVRFTLGD